MTDLKNIVERIRLMPFSPQMGPTMLLRVETNCRFAVARFDDKAQHLNPHNSHLGTLQIKVCRSSVVRLNATMAIDGASRCARCEWASAKKIY